DYALAVIDRGANLEIDLLGRTDEYGTAHEAQLVEEIVELLECGYASQVLLSHDTCSTAQLKAHGGPGFGYITQHFLPPLRTAAVGEGEIAAMTIENPRRILTVP